MGNGKLATQNAAHKVCLNVYQNSSALISNKEVSNEGYAFDDLGAIQVKQGDKITVALSRVASGTAATTFFNPVITYTEFASEKQTVYNAVEEFSGTTNPNGVWSYQYKSTTETEFKNMTVTNDAKTAW